MERTPEEQLRYELEYVTGCHGVYTWDLVTELIEAIDKLRPVKKCDLADVGGSFRCQREIEGESMCPDQCNHCKEYYAPLEK